MIATHSVSLAFTKAMKIAGGGFILPDRDQGAWLYRPDGPACGPDGPRLIAHPSPFPRHKRRWL